MSVTSSRSSHKSLGLLHNRDVVKFREQLIARHRCLQEMITHSDMSGNVLRKAHFVNCCRFAALLGSAAANDLSIPINFNITGMSFSSKYINSDIIEILNLSVRNFCTNYVVSEKLLFRVAQMLLQYPIKTVFTILLDHSTIKPDIRLKSIKDLNIINYDLEQISIVAIQRWVKCNSTGNPYFDAMSMLYSEKMFNPNIPRKFIWSPHLGVSFGHAAFILENLLSIDCVNGHESALYTYEYLSAPLEYTACFALKIQDALRVADSNLNCVVMHDDIDLSRYIELVKTPDNLIREHILLRLESAGFHTILSRKRLPTAQTTSSVERFGCSKMGIFANFIDFIVSHNPAELPSELDHFLSTFPAYVVVHSRDSAYSGASQTIRDSNFDNFYPTIKWYSEIGIGVIRISMTAIHTTIESPNFIDLSRVAAITPAIQLNLIKNSMYMLGTPSGISHLHYVSDKPMLCLNSLVPHPSAFPDSTMISMKIPTSILNSKLIENNIVDFTTSWSNNILNALQPRELTETELHQDIQFFHNTYLTKSGWPTLLSVLELKGIQIEDARDSYISPTFCQYLLNNLK